MLLLIGCGRLPYATVGMPRDAHNEVETLVQTFTQHHLTYTGKELHIPDSFQVYFTDDYMGERVLAQCWLTDNKVFVSKRAWEHANVILKEYVLFHEMGHCLLGIWTHTDTPLEIMNAGIGDEHLEAYRMYKQPMLLRLFNTLDSL